MLAVTLGAAVLAGCGGSSSPSAAKTSTTASSHAAVTPSTTATRTPSLKNSLTASTHTTHSTTTATRRSTPSTRASTTRTRRAAAVGLTLRTPHGQPRANALWPITVTSVPPEQGIVSYEFLYNGTIVSRQPGGQMRNGVYHDKLRFPPRAVGLPITLRVVLRMPTGQIVHTDRQVSVRP